MLSAEDDRGQFAPAEDKRDRRPSAVVPSCMSAEVRRDLAAFIRVIEMDMLVEFQKAQADARDTGTGMVELRAGDSGSLDRLRIRRVNPDEFRQDYPPAWPANIQPARQGSRAAQWKREKNRYRGR